MKWAHFLHIYQPADQHPGILEKIVNESYRPILRGLLKIPRAKVTLNINGVLVEKLFEHGYRDVIDDIKALVELGRVELTGSAKYHAFLPLIPEHEVVRQIRLNEETMKKYFGEFFVKKGFFSPEMGYSPKVAAVVERMGYKWMIVDEVSICEPGQTLEELHLDKTYKIEGKKLNVFFREKQPSNIIMGALVRSAESLKKVMAKRLEENTYVVTAMDGETFGHHRPGFEESFFDILKDSTFDNVFISEMPNFFPETVEVTPKDSSWASSAVEVAENNPYNLWFHPKNMIHSYEWDLVDLAVRVVNKSEYSDEKYPHMLEEEMDWEDMTDDQKYHEERKRQWVRVRGALDAALNSDPMWWASARPWWSVEMIEKGVNALYKVINETPDVSNDEKAQAESLYKNILFTAHEWQRAGMVDKMAAQDVAERKIPLSKRFAAEGVYVAMLKALKDQEMSAVAKREYEQAIKWRDSQYKLERDLDIYDAVHIIDLFRVEGDFAKFEEYLKEYRKKYRSISKGQPE